MKIRELFENNFQGFRESFGDEYMDSAHYIQHLSAATNEKIHDWDFEPFLSSQKKPYKDKKHLNKAFFEIFAKSKESDDKKEPFVIAPAIMSQIARDSETFLDSNLRQLKIQRDNYKQDAEAYMQRSHTCLKEVASLTTRIRAYAKKPEERLISSINEILSDSFWEFVSYGQKVLQVATKPELIVSHVTSTEKTEVNLGRFVALVNLETFLVLVKPHENNIFSCDHYHPHVSSNGSLCFGELRGSISRLVSDRNLPGLMKAVKNLIRSFHPEAPYQELQAFEMARALQHAGLLDSSHPHMGYQLKDDFYGALNSLSELSGKSVKVKDLTPKILKAITLKEPIEFRDGQFLVNFSRQDSFEPAIEYANEGLSPF